MASSNNKQVRSVYVRPQLTEFGSVRNLTGGSIGPKTGDGKSGMMA